MILALHNDSFLIPFRCAENLLFPVLLVLFCNAPFSLRWFLLWCGARGFPWCCGGLLDFQAASDGGRLVLGSCGEPRALPRGV